jgi:hypothetical protein
VEEDVRQFRSARARQLRDENAPLKRLVADLTLDKYILSEVLQKKSEADTKTSTGRMNPGNFSDEHCSVVSAGAIYPGGLVSQKHGAESGIPWRFASAILPMHVRGSATSGLRFCFGERAGASAVANTCACIGDLCRRPHGLTSVGAWTSSTMPCLKAMRFAC